MTILAMDLGKGKSVFCNFDTLTGAAATSRPLAGRPAGSRRSCAIQFR
ncbi:MAG: hypothetical protein ACE5I3_11440 [Phycisphaerae bacterium]